MPSGHTLCSPTRRFAFRRTNPLAIVTTQSSTLMTKPPGEVHSLLCLSRVGALIGFCRIQVGDEGGCSRLDNANTGGHNERFQGVYIADAVYGPAACVRAVYSDRNAFALSCA